MVQTTEELADNEGRRFDTGHSDSDTSHRYEGNGFGDDTGGFDDTSRYTGFENDDEFENTSGHTTEYGETGGHSNQGRESDHNENTYEGGSENDTPKEEEGPVQDEIPITEQLGSTVRQGMERAQSWVDRMGDRYQGWVGNRSDNQLKAMSAAASGLTYLGQSYGDHIKNLMDVSGNLSRAVMSGKPMSIASTSLNGAMQTFDRLDRDIEQLPTKYGIQPGTDPGIVGQTLKGEMMNREKRELEGRMGDASATVGSILERAGGDDPTQMSPQQLQVVQEGLDEEIDRLDGMMRSGVGPDGDPLTSKERRHIREMAQFYLDFNDQLRDRNREHKDEQRQWGAEIRENIRNDRLLQDRAQEQHLEGLRNDPQHGEFFQWLERNNIPTGVTYNQSNGYRGRTAAEGRRMRGRIDNRRAMIPSEIQEANERIAELTSRHETQGLTRVELEELQSQRNRVSRLQREDAMLQGRLDDLDGFVTDQEEYRFRDDPIGLQMHRLGSSRARRVQSPGGMMVPESDSIRDSVRQSLTQENSALAMSTDPKDVQRVRDNEALLDEFDAFENLRKYDDVNPSMARRYAVDQFFRNRTKMYNRVLDDEGYALDFRTGQRIREKMEMEYEAYQANPNLIKVPRDIARRAPDIQTARQWILDGYRDTIEHYKNDELAYKAGQIIQPGSSSVADIRERVSADPNMMRNNLPDKANRKKMRRMAQSLLDRYDEAYGVDDLQSGRVQGYWSNRNMIDSIDLADNVERLGDQMIRQSDRMITALAQRHGRSEAEVRRDMQGDLAIIKELEDRYHADYPYEASDGPPTMEQRDRREFVEAVADSIRMKYGIQREPKGDDDGGRGANPGDPDDTGSPPLYTESDETDFRNNIYTMYGPNSDLDADFRAMERRYGFDTNPGLVSGTPHSLQDRYERFKDENRRRTGGEQPRQALESTVNEFAEENDLSNYERRLLYTYLYTYRNTDVFRKSYGSYLFRV